MNKTLQSILDGAVARGEVVGISALVLRDGRELDYAQAGLADREQGRPFTRDTICRIYSQTKPITAFAAMKLWEDGRLDLDAPVSRYLPAFGADDAHARITVNHLLSMTSGLTYDGTATETERCTTAMLRRLEAGLDSPQTPTTQQLAAEIAGLPLAFEPGHGWKYGLSADVLGAVIEAASGETFRDYLRRTLFLPLGMDDTDFYVPEDKLPRLAQAYDFEGPETIPYLGSHLGIRHAMDRLPRFLSGGAGLASTLDDYAKFAWMLLNGGVYGKTRFLKSETVDALTTPQLNQEQLACFRQSDSWYQGCSYGHLMSVCQEPNHGHTLEHRGEYGWGGWLGSVFLNDPSTRTTLLMMMQRKGPGEPLRRVRLDIQSLYW